MLGFCWGSLQSDADEPLQPVVTEGLHSLYWSWGERLCDDAVQVMGRIDSLIAQAQKRGYSGEPVVSVTF